MPHDAIEFFLGSDDSVVFEEKNAKPAVVIRDVGWSKCQAPRFVPMAILPKCQAPSPNQNQMQVASVAVPVLYAIRSLDVTHQTNALKLLE